MPRKRVPAHRLQPLRQFDLAPFTGVVLALIGVFLLVCSPPEPSLGLVSLEATPRLSCNVCFNVPDHTQVYICLTADGRVSFATADRKLQAAVLAQVCQHYGVQLSAAQRANLATLPYLAVCLEQLPDVLATSSAGAAAPNYSTLTELQLLACLKTIRPLSLAQTSRPACFYLVAEAQTSALTIMALLHLLQQQQMYRLNLLTHCYPGQQANPPYLATHAAGSS